MMIEVTANTLDKELAVETTVDLIRGELRDEISFVRKEQRDAKLSKNRSALGELEHNDDYNEEYIIGLAKKLRKKSLSIQEYRKLQNALMQSEEHINAFFKVSNSIEGLIRDLSGSSVQSKLLAASCCCNLALGNPKACETLCKFAAPYIIAGLESINQPIVEACAWTIGNMVIKSAKAFSILQAQNCLRSLIKLAQQCTDTTLPSVSYGCLRYVESGINNIKYSDLVELASVMALRLSKVSDADSLWLIAILSSKEKCINSLNICLPEISDYFYEAICGEKQDIKKISAALRIICNTISEPSGQVALHLFRNGIEQNHSFLDKLLCHQYIHIRQESLWLIGNLLNHSLNTVQQIVIPIVNSIHPSLELALNSLSETT